MESYQTTITESWYETPDIKFFTLNRPEGFTYDAGQYINLEIERDGETRFKPYSLYSHPDDEDLTLCVKLVEDGFASSFFRDTEPHTDLVMHGPLGSFTADKEIMHHALLSTGAGIAPMNGIARELLQGQQNNVSLYHGVKTPKHRIRPSSFQDMESAHQAFSYYPVFSRDKSGERTGYVQDHVSGDPNLPEGDPRCVS
jgi:ferredoxin-NADP reductase